MQWFRPKPLVDEDEFTWLMACWAWLYRRLYLDLGVDFPVPQLASPGSELIRNAATASDLFSAVQHMTGLQEWECVLVQGDVDERDMPHVLGEFQENYGTYILN
jgi:hypothetical protein